MDAKAKQGKRPAKGKRKSVRGKKQVNGETMRATKEELAMAKRSLAQRAMLQFKSEKGRTGGPLPTRCGKLYQLALYNPFAAMPEAPCVPDILAIPSQKFLSKASGTFYIGTQGVGMVSVAPWMMAISDQNYSYGGVGRSSVHYSTAAYDFTDFGAGFTHFSGGAPPEKVGNAGNNSIYNHTAFIRDDLSLTDRQVRLVASAVVCRYIGDPLKAKGVWVMWRSPGNLSTIDDATPNIVRALNTTTVSTVQKGPPVYQNYIPVRPDDIQYTSLRNAIEAGGDNPVAGSTLPKITYFVGVMGGEPGETIDFEIFTWLEVIGTGVPMTRNTSDPTALGNILSAAPSVAHNPNPNQSQKQALQAIHDHHDEQHAPSSVGTGSGTSTMSSLKNSVGSAAMNAVSELISSVM